MDFCVKMKSDNNQNVSEMGTDTCPKHNENRLSRFCLIVGYAGIVIVLLLLIPITYLDLMTSGFDPGPKSITHNVLIEYAHLFICYLFGRALYFLIPLSA